jgi:hypothetical protein
MSEMFIRILSDVGAVYKRTHSRSPVLPIRISRNAVLHNSPRYVRDNLIYFLFVVIFNDVFSKYSF